MSQGSSADGCATHLAGEASLRVMRDPMSLVTPTTRTTPAGDSRVKRYLEQYYKKLPFALQSAQAQKQLADRAKTITEKLLNETSQENLKPPRDAYNERPFAGRLGFTFISLFSLVLSTIGTSLDLCASRNCLFIHTTSVRL